MMRRPFVVIAFVAASVTSRRRPHLGASFRGYMADSRGHWAGQTLVVETVNFNDPANPSY
jgi:hypothetical protein